MGLLIEKNLILVLFLYLIISDCNSQIDSLRNDDLNYEISFGESFGSSLNTLRLNKTGTLWNNSKFLPKFLLPNYATYSYSIGVSNKRYKISFGLYHFFSFQDRMSQFSNTFQGLEIKYFPWHTFRRGQRFQYSGYATYGLEVGTVKNYNAVLAHRFGVGVELNVKLWKKIYSKINTSLNAFTIKVNPQIVAQFYLMYRI